MLYKIIHKTTYTYNQLVWLKPHLIRLKPRNDCWQEIKTFNWTIEPLPQRVSQFIDLDGNNLLKTWFNEATEELELTFTSEVETLKTNPFDYLLESWAVKFPIDYPSSLLCQLQPYLQPYMRFFDPLLLELAQDIALEVDGNTMNFLFTLNQRIYENFEYITREVGDCWSAGVTLKKKQGSCRDLTIVFMEACRAMGLAARFVSGYQEGDREQDSRDLHAWAEVYLPGGGWRGYDPTLGLAVCDRHVALVASAIPSYAAAVTGQIKPFQQSSNNRKSIESKITADISIQYL